MGHKYMITKHFLSTNEDYFGLPTYRNLIHMTTTILNWSLHLHIKVWKWFSKWVTHYYFFWVAILRKQLNFHSYTTIHSSLQYKKLCKKTFWATHYLTKEPVDVDTRILSHYSRLYIWLYMRIWFSSFVFR